MPHSIREAASSQRITDRFSIMTVLLLMLHFTAPLPLQMLLWSLAFLALLFGPVVRRHWGFWTAVVSVMAAGLVQLLRGEGNDVFLIFYMALTALVASHHASPLHVLQTNARWLIALVMSFATFWKTITPSFRSGDFFMQALLFEERLAPFTLFLAKLPREAYEANHQALSSLRLSSSFLVQTNDAVLFLAQLLTWLTVLVEAAVATAFILPQRFSSKARDLLLTLFCAGTYLILPVPSFGMAISALGYIQTASPFARRIYLALYILMPLTAVRVFLFNPSL